MVQANFRPFVSLEVFPNNPKHDVFPVFIALWREIKRYSDKQLNTSTSVSIRAYNLHFSFLFDKYLKVKTYALLICACSVPHMVVVAK